MTPDGRSGKDAVRLAAVASQLLFAGWVAVANLSKSTANDLFIHLRVGADILATGKIPHVDTYSAVAAGRPFIAHEWLSGVVFAGIDRALGGIGLSVLQAVCPLAAAIFLYGSLGKPHRDRVAALPLLGLCSYLVAFRVEVRPHLFSLLILSVFVFAIERWRREGSVRRVWWLLPVQVVWVNLHGEFLLGPALFAIVTGVVGLMVLIPTLQRSAEPRKYDWRDVRTLAGFSLALLLACLINPNGVRILVFAVEMWGQNEFIKKAVFEWQTPFLAANHRKYWFLAYCVVLGALWLGVLLRARTLPLLDIALAIVFTVMSARSQRFVAHLAIVGFPVIVRSFDLSLGWLFEERALRRRPLVEAALAIVLIASTVKYGYAYSATIHRQVGWGYGGDMPYKEVEFLKAGDASGGVYNEYSDGALIIRELSPRLRPVMDSRIDVYGEELYTEYVRSRSSPDRFYAYLDRYRCNVVLLQGAPNRQIYQALDRNPEWRLALRTKARFMFVRVDPIR